MKLYFGLFFGLLVFNNALAVEFVESNIYGDQKIFDCDVVVADGVNVGVDSIKIADSMRIDNYGTINSSISLCDGCELFITNYGVVESQFSLGQGSKIVQYVTAQDNMKRIDFNVGYDIVFDSDEALDFSDVVQFADAANSLLIKNTTLNLNSVPNNGATSVRFGEGVVINIGDLDVLGKTLVLDNVTVDTNLRFYGVGDNPMYVKRGYVYDGGLYIERVRETDYTKVLGGRLGTYVNSLRYDDGAADLMQMLDTARDMNEIHRAMNKTVRMNPVLLKNKMESLHFANILNFDSEKYGAGLSLFGVVDSDMTVLGVGAGYRFGVGDVGKLDLNFGIGKMFYSSDIDEFEANVYSGRVQAEFDVYKELLLRVGAGAILADLDIGSVFYNGRVFDNPLSLSGYANVDLGYKFNLSDCLYLMPVVGIDAHFYDIENYAVTDVFMRIGGDLGYGFTANAIEYQYMLRAYVNSDAIPSIMGRVGFWSDMDGFGGHLSFGVIHMNDMTGYNFTINAQIEF